MVFQDKLQLLRKKEGLTQEGVAEKLGVSRQAVSKWESGQSYPDMDKLIALSDLFDVSIDSLIKDHSGSNEKHEDVKAFYYYKRMHYEFKSKKTLFHLPLVHINIGPGFQVAKGILAIGNISIGWFSVGGFAVGGLCLGGFSLGLFGLGGFVLSLLLAVGGFSVGSVAIGGVAIGFFALGGVAIGMFSFGGAAIASHVAIGGYANGHVAIGQSPHGIMTLTSHSDSLNDISALEARKVIYKAFPTLPKVIVHLVTFLFR